MSGLKANARTAWRRVEDEVLIIASDTNKLTVLNDTAARIWELLRQENDCEAIAQQLVAEYRVDLESARRDVATMLRELESRGLVVDEG